MKGKFFDSYVSKKGNDVFKYEVTGTKEEIAKFEAQQPEGKNYKSDAGHPIFFSSRFGGNTIELDFTREDNRVFIKNTGERQVMNKIKQNQDNLFGQAMASEYAKRQLDAMLGGSTTAPGVKKAKTTPVSETDEQDEAIENLSPEDIQDAPVDEVAGNQVEN